MAQYQLEPSNRPPRPGGILSLILLFIVVVGLMILASGLFWIGGSRLFLGPTSTPTATPASVVAATPDFRETRAAEDILTATAYGGNPLAGVTANPPVGVTFASPVVTSTPAQIVVVPTNVPTEETYLPVIQGGEATATDQLLPEGLVPVQPPVSDVPTATPLALPTTLPTATETPVILVTPTSTAVVLPTTPAQPTATHTPTPYTWYNMAATMRGGGASGRTGPSTVYESVLTFDGGASVKLNGRTQSGEWVLASRTDNNDFRWIRQADVNITGNTAPDNIPQEVKDNPNDVRWLDIIHIVSGVEPLPVPTPMPEDDWPLYRRTPDNRGIVETLPALPWNQGWFAYEAGGSFISPIVVTGSNAVVASSDKHLHSVNRYEGNQRWRNNNLNDHEVRFAPALHQDSIFVVDNTGLLYRFRDQGNAATIVWQQGFNMTPTSGINLSGEHIYFTGTQGNQQKLWRVRREDANSPDPFAIEGTPLTYPTVGDQLVYIGGDQIWAVDKNNVSEQIWGFGDDIGIVTAPPVYVSPGRLATAELYIGEDDGTVHILDANIGRRLATVNSEREVTGIAVGNDYLFVTGVGQLRIYRLSDLQLLHSIPLEVSKVLGGPVADGTRVLVGLESGNVQMYDVLSAQLIGGQSSGSAVSGATVGGQWILLPGTNGNLTSIQGSGDE